MKKKYSAGLVSRRFWFPEFKLYVQLRLDGLSDNDIKYQNDIENIFLAPSSNRQKEIFQGVKRRISLLDSEGLELFTKLDIDNQKLFNFSVILMLDDLFTDFMIEIFSEKVRTGNLVITRLDYRSFFSEKQRTSEDMKNWKEYTTHRLEGIYHTYLSEAGLIQSISKEEDRITPRLLDKRLIQWLIDQGRRDVVIALGGIL